MIGTRLFPRSEALGYWRSGESFSAVARRYRVTPEAVRAAVIREVPDEYALWVAERRRAAGAVLVCPGCGGHKSRAASLCRACAHPAIPQRARILWTREMIIERVQQWNRTHGQPPTATDWNPSMLVGTGLAAKAESFYSGCWPQMGTVSNHFGSWSAAIAAAGFPPRLATDPRAEARRSNAAARRAA